MSTLTTSSPTSSKQREKWLNTKPVLADDFTVNKPRLYLPKSQEAECHPRQHRMSNQAKDKKAQIPAFAKWKFLLKPLVGLIPFGVDPN
jgi:hypothetical protein